MPITMPDQTETIQQLRERLDGNSIAANLPPGLPADMEEEFLRHVLECDTAEPDTLLRVLENTGPQIAPPDQVPDRALPRTLVEIINRMARIGAYLIHTNHLSDRQLYEYLFNDGLREEAILFPENPSYAYIIDLTGSGSDEDTQIYLKHYADEAHRQQWAHDWPDEPIPEHEDPPFDRDQYLPQSLIL